ncbi:hypothetical protein [Tsuneonella sp. SYSU-LHT278]|uniref:hypothetical protein n=1 Tax=Tsuneonella sediminis TaxID=3416089 RepID=UPI003F7A08BB
MSFWTALVVMTAIFAFMVLRIVRIQSEAGKRNHAAPADDGEKTALRGEIDDLRERIKVLERIATDANTSAAIETRRVSDEIEALRDSEKS